ncbi:MAG: ribonuclease III [bacterium]
MTDHQKLIDDIQKKLNIKFFNSKILLNALTHKSYAIEQRTDCFNERLEFLGDSILSAVVVEYLYNKYPTFDEGKLSRMKSQIVSKASLVTWSHKIGLSRFLLLSQGEESSGGRKRESICANVLEALIGALYLDQGYEVIRQFILKYLSKMKRIIDTDYKSKLQEIAQKKFRTTPDYCIVQETGPDHNKLFKIEVKVNNKKYGTGSGRSKKEAEQSSAHSALKKLEG